MNVSTSFIREKCKLFEEAEDYNLKAVILPLLWKQYHQNYYTIFVIPR